MIRRFLRTLRITTAISYPAFAISIAASAVLVSATACGQTATVRATSTVPDSLANFGALIARLSDDGGFFDTDNLISNELGYQQVLGAIQRLGVSGGAYIGVGPDQNFTYIAHIKPRIAFLVDIRRDNMLQHLLFKALFTESPNRAEYLALWTGRPVTAGAFNDVDAPTLVALIDSSVPTPASMQRAREVVTAAVTRMAQSNGIPLTDLDYATIARFHNEFIVNGLSLRFHSAGRSPQPHHPTLRQLILEHDTDGTMRSYLANETDFQFVKSMQRRNLIVPVTGDLAGPRTLPEIGRYLAEHGERVSALYSSNVEDYLLRDGRFSGFLSAVRELPRMDNGVIIRSYFGGGFGHPEATPEYYATQLLQRMDSFVSDAELVRVRRYRDLVNRDWVPLRRP